MEQINSYLAVILLYFPLDRHKLHKCGCGVLLRKINAGFLVTY